MSNGTSHTDKPGHQPPNAGAKPKVKFTEARAIGDFSSDGLKFALQQAREPGDMFAHGITGDAEEKKRRYNSAYNQGGDAKEPNTQPATNPDTFNKSGAQQSGAAPLFVPEKWLSEFVAQWNEYARVNLHTGGKKSHDDKPAA